MRKIKSLTAIVLVAVFLFCTAVPVYAELVVGETPVGETEVLDDEWDQDGQRRYNSVTYQTLDENENFPFDRIVVDDEGRRWFLWGVDYEVDSTATSREQYVTVTVEYYDLYEKEVPDSIVWINPINGTEHTLPLISARYSDTIITDRTDTVMALIDYGWQTYIPNPKDEMTITYFDEPSGEYLTGTVEFQDLILVHPFRWRKDVEVPAVFEVYEAEYYKMVGYDILIPYNNDMPEISGQESDIAKALDENPDRFRFTASEWTSDVYIENGVEKRNGILTGERYVAQYNANYASEWELPDAPGFDCIAVYGATIDALDGTEEYTIIGDSRYLPLSGGAAALTVIGILLFIIGIVVLLIILAKRRKKDDDKDRPDDTKTKSKPKRQRRRKPNEKTST